MNVTFESESKSSKFLAGVAVGLAGAAALLYASKKLNDWVRPAEDPYNPARDRVV